jgi:hypothetical protein
MTTKKILDIHEIETSDKETEVSEKVSEEVSKLKQTFSKEQILLSKKYMHRKDVVNVVLEKDKVYTLDEVEGLIEKFMKDEVK